jgi:hypothetical protein
MVLPIFLFVKKARARLVWLFFAFWHSDQLFERLIIEVKKQFETTSTVQNQITDIKPN